MMDPVVLATICSLITAVLTLGCTKGVDALIKWNKSRHQECREDDDVVSRNYEFVIGKLEARVTALEGALDKSNARELECIRAQERLQGEVNFLRATVERQNPQAPKVNDHPI